MSSWDEPYTIAVGDTIWEYNNVKSGGEGTIVKIGQTLVHVADRYGRITKYRKSDRQRNDGWSGYFLTTEQKMQQHLRSAMEKVIHDHGLQIRYGAKPWTTDRLEKLAQFLQDQDTEQ